MTEEQVTTAILNHLIQNHWTIVCFDFPQSGTGKYIHPNISCSKNLDAIIPDIIACKNNICLFFENKNRYYYNDFVKINNLITQNDYSNEISELLKDYNIEIIYYGIGFPLSSFKTPAIKHSHLVDFILGVNLDFSIQFCVNTHNISIK